MGARSRMVSVDVEALFTNVRINEAIDIDHRNAYKDESLLPPVINEPTFSENCC